MLLFQIIFVGFICGGILPEFGPMRLVEKRALQDGKLLNDDAVPLMNRELTEMKVSKDIKIRVGINFILPIAILLAILI